MAAVILHSLDESGNTCGGVILDVGSIVAGIVGPEEVAERYTTLEHLECAVSGVERERLEDNLTISVTNVHLAVLVELSVALRLGDDVPAPLVELLVNAGFHILRLSPAFLKLDVDTGAVSAVLIVGDIGVAEVVNEEVHVAGLSGPSDAFNLGRGSCRANLNERLALERVFHVVGEDTTALCIAVELFTLSVSDLVGKSTDVLAVGIDHLSVLVGLPCIESFLKGIVGRAEACAGLLKVVLIEPCTGVEHKELGIVVVAWIVAVVVSEVVVVLLVDVLLREVTRSSVLVGQ